MTLDARGTPPQEWPPEVVAKLEVAGGGSTYRAAGRIFLHVYAREAAPPAQVADALEHVLAVSGEMNGGLRLAYFAEAAFFQGVTRRDAALARAWLDDARAVKGAIAQKDWDASAMAAIAFAEGNEEEFRKHRARALEYLDRQPGPSGSVAASRAHLAGLSITEPVPSTHPPVA